MADTLERPVRTQRSGAPGYERELDVAALPAEQRHAEIAPHANPGDYRPFDDVESRNGLQERVELPLLLRALRLPTGGRVLELGCGRGVALPVLAERLAPDELVGIDVDAALIDRARERVARLGVAASLHMGDIRALPFPGGRFDLVIDFGTTYHVGGGVSGRLTALNEIARVLRVGGLFVHETRVAQHLAHPVRSLGRRLPWTAVPMLAPDRDAVLWAARKRVGPVLA